MKLPDWLRALARDATARTLILTIVIAAITGSSVAVVVSDDDPSTPDKTVISVPFPTPKSDEVVLADPAGGQIVADLDQTQQPNEKAAADERGEGVGIHEDAKDETPPGVSKDEIEFGKERTAQLAEEKLVPGKPVGGAGSVNCLDRPVVNQSSLSQRRVGVALHFTVSPFGSIGAIFRLFNTPSFGASSNYGFELITLECQRWVPENRKAWAQGAANSAYVSIEIVTNDLSRSQWLATPALKTGRLAQLVREISVRNGTPLKHVDPSGCVWTPGITDHDALECGNTHWDVGQGFPWDVFMKQVQRGVDQAKLTKVEQRIVAHVRKPKGSGHSQRYWCNRLRSARRAVARGQKHRRPARRRILARVHRGSC